MLWVPRKMTCQEHFDYILGGKKQIITYCCPWRTKLNDIFSHKLPKTSSNQKTSKDRIIPRAVGKHENIILSNIKESALSFPLTYYYLDFCRYYLHFQCFRCYTFCSQYHTTPRTTSRNFRSNFMFIPFSFFSLSTTSVHSLSLS